MHAHLAPARIGTQGTLDTIFALACGRFPSTPSTTPRSTSTRRRCARRSSGSTCRSHRRRPGAGGLSQARVAAADRIVQDSRRVERGAQAVTPEQMKDGVWTVSAGNAAQGVAFAARLAGVPCSVMVMDTAPETKLRAIEQLGATIVKATYDECWKTVESHASPRMRGHFVHPFDDDDFIAGNAHRRPRDPRGPARRRCGGRARSAAADCWPASASVMRARKPGVRVYAAEPETAAPLESVAAARRSVAASTRWQPSFVDGAGGKSVLPTMWPLLKDAGRPARSSCRSTRSRRRCARPPIACTSSPKAPAARAIAAALSGRAGTGKIVAVVSGGNIDLVTLLPNSSALTLHRHNMSEERFATAAPLPDRACIVCTSSRSICGGAGTIARAQVFRQLDYSLWRATAHNPVQMLQRDHARAARPRPRDPDFLKAYDEAIFGLDQARTVAHPWWREHAVDARQRQHRLLLRRVRAAPVAADLRRRPRRAGRRSLQGSRGPRPAVRRRRLHVSAGLLPPAHDQRRLAGRALRAHQLDRRADRSGDHARRPAVHHRRAARRSHRAGRGVARAPRPRAAVPARHRSRGERAVGSRAVGAPLRRRSRNAHPAGNHSRHRRRARAARAGHRADGVAPQRRPRRVRRAAAHPRDASSRAGRSTTRSKKCGDRRCSRRTRRCRPATTRSRSTWSRSTSPAPGARSASTARASSRSASTTTAAARSST